jgi:hypothetical protein
MEILTEILTEDLTEKLIPIVHFSLGLYCIIIILYCKDSLLD